MFMNCTSLKTAPKLEAKTLVSGCYNYMFSGCSVLNQITMLATQLSANNYVSNCLYEWVKDVASKGTFYKASAMSLSQAENWYDGIPFGWMVQNYGESNKSLTITLTEAGMLEDYLTSSNIDTVE